MGLNDIIKRKKMPQDVKPQPNDSFNNFGDSDIGLFSSLDNIGGEDPFLRYGDRDPFSNIDDSFGNFGNLQQRRGKKKKNEPHPLIIFLRKTKETMEKIVKKTETILKGKPPIAVFRTYSDIVVFHEDKGIKIIVNGYEYTHFSEWDLKGKKWKKITVKEVLSSEYTGDKVEGRGFLLTKFILPKTYIQGKLLYYEVSVYVGEFKGTLTKPVKIGNKYRKGNRVGIQANLLVVIREYSLVNKNGKFIRKEHILYTGGKLSEDLMKFIKGDKKKGLLKRGRNKLKPPELNPLEGTGMGEEIVIDKEDTNGENLDDFVNISRKSRSGHPPFLEYIK